MSIKVTFVTGRAETFVAASKTEMIDGNLVLLSEADSVVAKFPAAAVVKTEPGFEVV